MDALARDGVMFSQGYTSGHVCSPTRAGIMIGGYSQSVGVYTAGDGGRGFDPKKKIFPGYLTEEYVSTAIGKWHLDLDDDYPELKWHAMNRGFDEYYKFMGRGGHSYFNLRSDKDGKFSGTIYRNKQEAPPNHDQMFISPWVVVISLCILRSGQLLSTADQCSESSYVVPTYDLQQHNNIYIMHIILYCTWYVPHTRS